METNDLAIKLKELRALRGMSQEYLAEESRVSLRTIQRIENNESKPTGETLKRISVALGADIKELIGEHVPSETSDLSGTIIFLRKKLAQTGKRSEIKTFEKFIQALESLKEKELSTEQLDSIQDYITYLELEKIPSFSNELYKQKYKRFRTFLSKKLRFVPNNYYLHLAMIFAVPFALAFTLQSNIDFGIRIGVISVAILMIGIAWVIDSRIKRQNRSLRF
jgi:transcriptional regulator with XRE-family HTH domain